MNVKGGYVVREDDNNEIGHYLASLRRITIFFAMIIAVPVILWTITAFIRYQVELPKVSTFLNPLAAASTNAPEGSSFVEQPPDAPPSPPSVAQTTDTSSAPAAISNSPTPTVAKGALDLPPPFATNDVATEGATGAMRPAAATEAASEVLSTSAPLSGQIPLPRPRPVHTADRMPPPAPRPRSRPAVGDFGAQQKTTTDSPPVPPQQR
jgi:hypothetical protein